MRWGTLVVALACSSGGPLGTLRVDVVTDLVPVLEITEVRVVLNAAETRMRPVAETEDWAAGLRAAVFEEIPVGTFAELEVSALRGDEVVVSRRALTRVEEATGVTVVLSRSCRGVECPDADDVQATACLGGRCVDPTCLSGAEESCDLPLCECEAPAATCAESTCQRGVCLAVPVNGACDSGERCDPDVGCVPAPMLDAGFADAGSPDAGLDAGGVDAAVDPGVDASDVDAALDAGDVDSGVDAGAVDAGRGMLADRPPLRIASTEVAQETICRIAEGVLRCFGDNLEGKLARTGCATACPPAVVAPRGGASGWVEIAAGQSHFCALDDRGAVWCWGLNDAGELARPANSPRESATPLEVPLPWQAVAVSAGNNFACALSASRAEIACRGDNSRGQITLDSSDGGNIATPTLVPLPTDSRFPGGENRWVALDVASKHGCALDRRGGLWCWGGGEIGETGGDAADCSRQMAREVMGDVIDTSGGEGFRCALLQDGRLQCFGRNVEGQLATGSVSSGGGGCGECGCGAVFLEMLTPRESPRLRRIHSGRVTTCGLDDAGAAWCWGLSNFNQTGATRPDPGTISCAEFSCVATPLRLDLDVAGFRNSFTELGLGLFIGCGSQPDGRLLCWGGFGSPEIPAYPAGLCTGDECHEGVYPLE